MRKSLLKSVNVKKELLQNITKKLDNFEVKLDLNVTEIILLLNPILDFFSINGNKTGRKPRFSLRL